MVPTVVLAKNEYCEPRFEMNEKEQWIIVSRFFLCIVVLLYALVWLATPFARGGRVWCHTVSVFVLAAEFLQ